MVERSPRRQVVGSNPAGPMCLLFAMFHVYVLRGSKTGRRYVGSCADLDKRLRRHNLGHSKATRHGVPWTLVHRETFSNRADATRKERYYKTGRGRDELEQLQW
jgi:putative endonuclease